MHRPSQNLVIASEGGHGALPARFRPSNQALLVRSRSMNPSVADDHDQLAGMNALSGNGLGDNGLSGGAAQQRFAANVDRMRLRHLAQLGAMGSPNANPLPTQFSMTFDQAMRQMPAGATGQRTSRSVLDRIRRSRSDSWEIVKHMSGNTIVFSAELVRTSPTGRQVTITHSDDLATEQDARNYIAAHEFARNGVRERRGPIGFNRDLQSTANAGSSAAVRASQMVPLVASPSQPLPGMYQPGGNRSNLTQREVNRLEMDGLGDAARPSSMPIIVGALLVAGLFYARARTA